MLIAVNTQCKTFKELQADLDQSGLVVSACTYTPHTKPSRAPWGKDKEERQYKTGLMFAKPLLDKPLSLCDNVLMDR